MDAVSGKSASTGGLRQMPTPQQGKQSEGKKPIRKLSKLILEDDFSFGSFTNTLCQSAPSSSKSNTPPTQVAEDGARPDTSDSQGSTNPLKSAEPFLEESVPSKEDKTPGQHGQVACDEHPAAALKQNQLPHTVVTDTSTDTSLQRPQEELESQRAQTQTEAIQAVSQPSQSMEEKEGPRIHAEGKPLQTPQPAQAKAEGSEPRSRKQLETDQSKTPHAPVTVDSLLRRFEIERQCRPNQQVLKKLHSLPSQIAVAALEKAFNVEHIYGFSGLLKSILSRMVAADEALQGAPDAEVQGNSRQQRGPSGEASSTGPETATDKSMDSEQNQAPRPVRASALQAQRERKKIIIALAQQDGTALPDMPHLRDSVSSKDAPEASKQPQKKRQAGVLRAAKQQRKRRKVCDDLGFADAVDEMDDASNEEKPNKSVPDKIPKRPKRPRTSDYFQSELGTPQQKKVPKRAVGKFSDTKKTELSAESDAAAQSKASLPTLPTSNFVFQDLKKSKRKRAMDGSTATVKKLKKFYNKNGRLKKKYTDSKSWKDFQGDLAFQTGVHARRKSLAQWSASQKYLLNTSVREWKAFSPAVSEECIGTLMRDDVDSPIPQASHCEVAEGLGVSSTPSMNPSRVASAHDNGIENTTSTFADIDAVLKDNFGHSEFRPGQREAVLSVLDKVPTLLLLSTGWGKSLCYQLPAFMLRDVGITLVISPLVSLMADQLARLPKCLRGAALSGQQNRIQERQVMKAVRARLIDVLFVSPERLPSWSLNDRYLPPIALACIDEAHCVSEWSHNFRPNYLRLNEFLVKNLGAQRLLAMTATATRQTIQSVCSTIKIDTVVRSDCKFKVQDLMEQVAQPRVQRKNLIMSVTRVNDSNGDAESNGALLGILRSEACRGKSTIIYCWRKATVDGLTKYLRQFDMGSVCAYHGDLTPEQRQLVQTSFMEDKLKIVVATMAFGMGLDKPDIRVVIHFNMPKSLENYIQETGRASRDGEPGYCHLLLNQKDLKTMRWIESANGGGSSDAGSVQKILRIAFSSNAKGPQKCFVQSNDDRNQPLKEPINHVTFDEKIISRELNTPVDEVHSVLAQLALRSDGYLRLYSSFPTQLKIRFFKTDVKLLKERDPFLRMLLGNAKVNSGVHTIQTGDAISRLGCEPSRLFSTLWECCGEEYTVEKDSYGFLLSIVKIPPLEKQMAWASEISTIARQTKDSALTKLDAAFVAFSRTAEAKTHEQDAVLNKHLDAYFGAPPSADAVEVLAGGDVERANILRQALGSEFVERQDRACDSAGAKRQAALKVQVYAQVARLLSTGGFPEYITDDTDSKARAVAQILAGVGSSMFPVKTWKTNPCWAKFENTMDFSLLKDLVAESMLELQERMKKMASIRGGVSAPTTK
eukprot:gnl/MRDRNA2_/MRDRNA2_74331_c0_seq2.p1 gnl/MRDRNA2_/MRDRNA2_74331_c0~~gnl/MRDRNA2_/MRDRNA2_74331_c0_seq2.p1  ORF type:complete len:1515 (+),score=328.52 gnl/MRDRNA2_/MRDRNA2_74331_c0_seq2:388-4545(+)